MQRSFLSFARALLPPRGKHTRRGAFLLSFSKLLIEHAVEKAFDAVRSGFRLSTRCCDAATGLAYQSLVSEKFANTPLSKMHPPSLNSRRKLSVSRLFVWVTHIIWVKTAPKWRKREGGGLRRSRSGHARGAFQGGEEPRVDVIVTCFFFASVSKVFFSLITVNNNDNDNNEKTEPAHRPAPRGPTGEKKSHRRRDPGRERRARGSRLPPPDDRILKRDGPGEILDAGQRDEIVVRRRLGPGWVRSLGLRPEQTAAIYADLLKQYKCVTTPAQWVEAFKKNAFTCVSEDLVARLANSDVNAVETRNRLLSGTSSKPANFWSGADALAKYLRVSFPLSLGDNIPQFKNTYFNQTYNSSNFAGLRQLRNGQAVSCCFLPHSLLSFSLPKKKGGQKKSLTVSFCAPSFPPRNSSSTTSASAPLTGASRTRMSWACSARPRSVRPCASTTSSSSSTTSRPAPSASARSGRTSKTCSRSPTRCKFRFLPPSFSFFVFFLFRPPGSERRDREVASFSFFPFVRQQQQQQQPKKRQPPGTTSKSRRSPSTSSPTPSSRT